MLGSTNRKAIRQSTYGDFFYLDNLSFFFADGWLIVKPVCFESCGEQTLLSGKIYIRLVRLAFDSTQPIYELTTRKLPVNSGISIYSSQICHPEQVAS